MDYFYVSRFPSTSINRGVIIFKYILHSGTLYLNEISTTPYMYRVNDVSS